MNKALITVEAAGILAAIILGGLWIYDPSGRLGRVDKIKTDPIR